MKWMGFVVLFVSCRVALAQVPYVSELNPAVARPGETVILQGINFGTNAGDIRVSFGGVEVAPEAISDQFIRVAIPVNAAFDNVRVLNTSTRLSGASALKFLPTFGGDDPFNFASTGTQQDFNSEAGLYDLAVADLDRDGRLDVVTANQEANTISVFRNTGSSGTIALSKTTLSPGYKTIHVTTGDLNGDGELEVIVSELNGRRITIYRNNSTPGTMSFAPVTLTLPAGTKAKQLKVGDLDLDGRPELVVTDQSQSRFFVFVNQSAGGVITLAAPIAIDPGGTSGTDAIDIQDLDGDRFPEIVVGYFQSVQDDLYVVKNNCSPGTIDLASLSRTVEVEVPNAVSNIKIADLNADGKPEITGTLLLSNAVVVLRNESSSTGIDFDEGTVFESNLQPWGLDVADVDGDSKPDIAIASINQKVVTLLRNTSNNGTFQFTKNSKTTTFFNRHISLSDLNNDGRPDFVFTSITNGGSVASEISVVKNLSCVVPKILPEGPLVICSSFTQELTATPSQGAFYEWFRNGVSQGAPSASNSFAVSQNGPFTVQMTSDAGACTKVSQPVAVTVINQAPLGTATPQPVAPMCVGGTLTLTVNDVGANQYRWTGPENFTANGLSVPRANFQSSHAGEYTLEVIVNGCVTQRETVIVDVVAVPDVEIVFPGLDIICTGETKALTFNPSPNGYDFQWMEEATGPINGATGSSFVVNTSGEYFLRLTSNVNVSCPPIDTESQKIRVVNKAVADFTYPDPGCVGVEIEFVNTSVLDSDPEDQVVHYTWKFSDQQNPILDVESPKRTFSSTQSVLVTLIAAYREGVCSDTTQATLTLVQPPAATIESSTGDFSFCPGDELDLTLVNEFDSYSWSTGDTDSEITVTQAGTYTVTATSGSCTISNSRVVEEFPSPTVTATAEPSSINAGDQVTLTATGLSTYRWRPNEGITDSLSAIATAFPLVPMEFVVSGVDVNGCFGSDTVEVFVVPEDDILSLLDPANFFSPNADGVNDVWVVEGLDPFNCTVTIYNERGLKVYEREAYDNQWTGDGINGQKLPEGVYFYVIRCDGAGDKALTGTITILR